MKLSKGKLTLQDVQIYAKHGQHALTEEPSKFTDTVGHKPMSEEQAIKKMDSLVTRKASIFYGANSDEREQLMKEYERLSKIIGDDRYQLLNFSID